MEKQVPTSLLDKYLNGKCNAEEEAIVKEWYNSFINDPDHVSAMGNIQRADLKLRIKKAIDENIELLQKTTPEVETTKTLNLSYWAYSIAGIAAMLLLVFGLKLFNAANNNVTETGTPIELVSITNNTKIIQEQVLSDGSHVWLYPGARIRFNKIFTGKSREVTMSGESFFDVAKDASKPFIIYSDHMVTKVWGTSFRVRDSKAGGPVDVTVVTGKVSVVPVKNAEVADNAGEVMLQPNEQVTFSQRTEDLKHNVQVNDKELNIWKKVRLSFNNSPISEVIPVLNRHYHVNIVSTDEKLNAYLLDADLNGLNFVAVMEILRKSLNISYEINNTSITLKNNNL